MERKEFLKATMALCGLSFVPAAMLQSCSKGSNTAAPANVNFTLDLTAPANSGLNTVGGSVISNGVIVIRSSSSAFTALSSVCTHEGCIVAYQQSGSKLHCPCHNGVFDINGNVVSGPPPSALQKYSVTQSGNTLTVKS